MEDVDKLHISEVVHFCFSNEVYVKKEQVTTNFLRIYVETPSKTIKGNSIYRIGDKKDMKNMSEKIDELYRYFYKKIKEEQKK